MDWLDSAFYDGPFGSEFVLLKKVPPLGVVDEDFFNSAVFHLPEVDFEEAGDPLGVDGSEAGLSGASVFRSTPTTGADSAGGCGWSSGSGDVEGSFSSDTEFITWRGVIKPGATEDGLFGGACTAWVAGFLAEFLLRADGKWDTTDDDRVGEASRESFSEEPVSGCWI